MNDFTEKFIKKWESHYGRQHKGLVELNKGQNLIYWDNSFVQDILKYAEKFYKESATLKLQMADLLKELKHGKKNTTLSGTAAEVSRLSDLDALKKEEDQEEGSGDATPSEESELSGGGEGVLEGMSVSDQVAGKVMHNS